MVTSPSSINHRDEFTLTLDTSTLLGALDGSTYTYIHNADVSSSLSAQPTPPPPLVKYTLESSSSIGGVIFSLGQLQKMLINPVCMHATIT